MTKQYFTIEQLVKIIDAALPIHAEKELINNETGIRYIVDNHGFYKKNFVVSTFMTPEVLDKKIQELSKYKVVADYNKLLETKYGVTKYKIDKQYVSFDHHGVHVRLKMIDGQICKITVRQFFKKTLTEANVGESNTNKHFIIQTVNGGSLAIYRDSTTTNPNEVIDRFKQIIADYIG